MDKNHIHIDEVVRQRLAGAEEERRPGAWFAMREVLDKAMPVGGAAVSAFNWRRMLSYTGALLVAASASFGGYKLYEKQKASNQLAVNSSSTPTKVEGSTGVNPGGSIAATSNTVSTPANGTSSISGVSDRITGNSTNLPISDNSIASVQPRNNRNSSNSNTGIGNTVTNTTVSGTPSGLSNGISGRNGTTSNEAAASTTSTTRNLNRTNPVTNSNSSLERSTTSAVPTTAAAAGNEGVRNSRNRNRQTRNANRKPAGEMPVLVATNSGASTAGTAASAKTRRVLKNDTLNIIEQAIRPAYNPVTNRAVPKIDTLSKRMIITAREVEVPVYDEARIKQTNPRYNHNPNGSGAIVPQAAPKAPVQFASENAATEAQKGEMVKARKEQISLWDRINMQSAIDRTRSAFAQIEYRGGVAGGLNNTIGGTSLFGFQLGFMGIAFISSEWSLMAELKYFQRANRGGSFSDDYVHRSPAGGGNVWEDSVNHFFNYSTLQTIELPIMARYVKKNFYGLLGLNMTRTLPVNLEEVTHQHNNPTLQQSTTLSPNARQSADISNRDFDPRFGMGYIVGLGYQFTPALGVDFRIAQMLWDNARNDNGAQRVSKELYKVPSLQLTVGYRLGKNK